MRQLLNLTTAYSARLAEQLHLSGSRQRIAGAETMSNYGTTEFCTE
jgi:hypothetical protein